MLDLIRKRIRELPNLRPLFVDPILKDVSGSVDGESVSINNELHTSKGLRKIHLEIAQLGTGLQILHCVFFPDPRYDLPIFGADVVVSFAGVSAAIVDLSPVGESLPLTFLEPLKNLAFIRFDQERPLPGWGCVFSKYVKFIRPVDRSEELAFLEVVDDYLQILISNIILAKPESKKNITTIKRKQAQIDYCYYQKLNEKTRGALVRAFDEEWADRYINEILFDSP